MRSMIGRKLLLFVLLTALAACFNAAPAFAQFNPIQAAKDAWNKAKQLQQQGQQPASQPASAPANTSGQPSSAQPANSGAQPAPSSTSTGDSGQGGGAPWAPPPDNPSAAPAGPLDPAKLPDVLGIHVAAPIEEVPGILHKIHPSNQIVPLGSAPVFGVRFGGDLPNGGENIYVEYTTPPNKQVVYIITREANYPNHPISRENFISALRQKYGQETLYRKYGGGNDIMSWVFDEQGHAVPAEKNTNKTDPFGCGIGFTPGGGWFRGKVNEYLHGELPPATICDSFILLSVSIRLDATAVYGASTTLIDNALFRREVIFAGEARKAEALKQQQQNLKNANQAKPNL
jgi:hypothetical protein